MVSNLLLAIAFLFLTIPALIYKQFFFCLATVIYGVIFVLMEYADNYYTGHTITLQMWDLIEEHSYKAWIILGFFLLGCISLLLHLGIRFKN